MNLQDIRKKTKEEIKAEIAKSEKEIEKITMNVLKEKEKNVKKVRFLKKDIARLKTVLVEKEQKGEKNGK